jgi:serine/threonine protein kinase
MEPIDPDFENQLDADLIAQTHDIEKLTWYRDLFSRSAAPLSDAIRGKLGFLLFIYAERDGDRTLANEYLTQTATREYIRTTLDVDLKAETHDIEKLTRYRILFSRSAAQLGDAVRGKLGFLLFIYAQRDGDTTLANEYLKLTATREYIRTTYDVLDPVYGTSVLTFYRAGTTSYILKHEVSGRVLKIVKPPFCDSPQIKIDNKAYQDKYGPLYSKGITPRVYSVGSLFIDMEYVDAGTLTEFFETYIYLKPHEAALRDHESKIMTVIEEVFTKLCSHLEVCSALNLPHLDLSPENILVKANKKGEVEKLVLIDFGRNTLLTERVGAGGPQWVRAQCFVARELFSAKCEGSSLSDVFSVGKIFLEALSKRKLSIHELSRDLDEIWLAYPECAGIIEDMIAELPEHRLLNRSTTMPMFEYVGTVIVQELNVFRVVRAERASAHRDLLDGVSNVLGPVNTLVDWVIRLRTLPVSEGTRLLKCAYRVMVIHWAVLCSFVIALGWFRDKRVCDLGHFCVGAINSPSPTPLSGFLFVSGFLPGRIVAVSFSFVCVQYYWQLFSRVSVRNLKIPSLSALAGWAERFMRGIWCLPFAAILYAIVVDPKAWPFCSGIGVLWIGVNNHVMSKVTVRANELLEGDPNVPESRLMAESSLVTEKVREFAAWAEMIYYYAGALLLLGVLLMTNVLKDEWFYGLILVPIVNILKMYKQNCTDDAPPLRSVMERLVAGLRRLERKTAARPA